VYDLLGKAAIRLSVRYLRSHYRRQIRVGVGLGAALVGVAVYLAVRNVPEG
jgi:hypothetical protein